MNQFSQDSAVEKIGDNHWRGQLSDDWCIGPVPNGGYVLAVAAKALSAALPHRDPLTINAYYLASPDVGPIDCHIEVLRSGGSTSFAMVKMVQDDKLKVQITAAYTELDSLKGETRIAATAPTIPSFDECVIVPTPVDIIKVGRYTAMRVVPGMERSFLGEPTGNAYWNGWLDFKDMNKADSPVDLFALLYFTDAFPPPAFNYYGPLGWVPTIELNVQIRAKPVAGPIQCNFEMRYLTKGVLEEDGTLWDCEGNIVALSRQTAKLRLSK